MRRRLLVIIVAGFILVCSSLFVIAIPPPKPEVLQNLSFGSFSTGSVGGSVTVTAAGTRSKTGDLYLDQSSPGTPGIILVHVLKDRLYTITIGGISNLSNGAGATMTLAINDFNPASPFSTPDLQVNLYVGGTLTVGPNSSTPPGNYSGSFDLTFNLQ